MRDNDVAPQSGVVRAGGGSSLRLCGAVAVALFLWFLLLNTLLAPSLQDGGSTDYKVQYRPVAERIVAGDGITTSNGEAALQYPPGFSLLIAVPVMAAQITEVDADLLVRLACAATFAATGVVLLILHRERFGRLEAWLGLGCWATYPVMLWAAIGPNVELPFMLALAVVALLVSRSLSAREVPLGRAALLGALAGACALIRPNGAAMVLPIALAIWLATSTQPRSGGAEGPLVAKRIGTIALMAGTALIVVAPWITWASRESGRLVPLSTNGPATIAAGLEVGGGRDEEVGSTWIPGPARDLATEATKQEQMNSMGEIMDFALGEFQEHPDRVVSLLAIKAARSWYGTDSFRWDNLLAGMQAVYVTLMAWGLWAYRRRDRQSGYVAFLIATLVISWLGCIAVVSIVRILTPALMLLVWFVPVGPLWWIRRRASPSSLAQHSSIERLSWDDSENSSPERC